MKERERSFHLQKELEKYEMIAKAYEQTQFDLRRREQELYQLKKSLKGIPTCDKRARSLPSKYEDGFSNHL